MKQDETRPRGYQDDEPYDDEDMFSVMSSTECTGLIPTPPVNEMEADSYTQIYDIPMNRSKKPQNLQSEKKTDTEDVGITGTDK